MRVSRCKTVAKKFSKGGLCVCAGGLNILKIDENSTDLVFHVSIWGGLELCLGGINLSMATGLPPCRAVCTILKKMVKQ